MRSLLPCVACLRPATSETRCSCGQRPLAAGWSVRVIGILTQVPWDSTPGALAERLAPGLMLHSDSDGFFHLACSAQGGLITVLWSSPWGPIPGPCARPGSGWEERAVAAMLASDELVLVDAGDSWVANQAGQLQSWPDAAVSRLGVARLLAAWQPGFTVLRHVLAAFSLNSEMEALLAPLGLRVEAGASQEELLGRALCRSGGRIAGGAESSSADSLTIDLIEVGGTTAATTLANLHIWAASYCHSEQGWLVPNQPDSHGQIRLERLRVAAEDSLWGTHHLGRKCEPPRGEQVPPLWVHLVHKRAWSVRRWTYRIVLSTPAGSTAKRRILCPGSLPEEARRDLGAIAREWSLGAGFSVGVLETGGPGNIARCQQFFPSAKVISMNHPSVTSFVMHLQEVTGAREAA